MVDTPTGLRLLHDDWYGSRSPDAWWSSPFSLGHLELVLSLLEDSPTPRCLHGSRVRTFGGDAPPRSTRYRLCCTHSSDSSRASICHGNAIYKECHLNFKTSDWHLSKEKAKRNARCHIRACLLCFILTFSLYVNSLFFVRHHNSFPLMFFQYLLWTSLGQISASVCFWPYFHCFFSWRTSRTMAYTGCSQHLLRCPWPILLAHTYHQMIQPRHHTFPGRPGWSQLLQPSTPFLSRSSATLLLLVLMNSGSLNKQQMAEKLGSQWKPFWKTCTSHVIGLHYVLQPTIGAGTTTYPSLHPLPLRQHFLRFSHILNIPTYVSHNHMMPSQINYTFSNLAGDALLNTIHRVPLFLYLGHHGDLHHHPHHQPHFTGPYTRTTILHRHINLTDQYHLTNRALWICRTPACNAPLRFATVKKTDYMGIYWSFNVMGILLPLFSRYSSLPFDNIVNMQLGLNLFSSTPWLLPLVLIHIALHPRWTHLKALELRHGLLDTEAFLATGTLLHPDPSWS